MGFRGRPRCAALGHLSQAEHSFRTRSAIDAQPHQPRSGATRLSGQNGENLMIESLFSCVHQVLQKAAEDLRLLTMPALVLLVPSRAESERG